MYPVPAAYGIRSYVRLWCLGPLLIETVKSMVKSVVYTKTTAVWLQPGQSQPINPPSSTVRDSKLQVNRPKSLSCIISSLAAALRDSSYGAAEQLSRPASEQAGKVRELVTVYTVPTPIWPNCPARSRSWAQRGFCSSRAKAQPFHGIPGAEAPALIAPAPPRTYRRPVSRPQPACLLPRDAVEA
jgi:hypothetical protein